MVKAKHTSPLDQILIDEEYPETRRLESCLKKDSLENIADKKTAGSFEVWKFNENKTVEWLEKKVVKLSNHLREKKVNVQQSSISSNYVKSSNAEVPESMLLTVFTRINEISSLFQIFYRLFLKIRSWHDL